MNITAEPTTFHEWLFHATKHGSVSVIDIMEDVADYGERLPAFMPTNGISAQEMLTKLEREGKAKREPGGTLWRWAEPVSQPVVETKPKPKQKDLFA